MSDDGDARRPVPVTVLGLGLMGQALAGAFLDRGHPTTVWNRTAAKAGELVARGARAAGSPAEAVAAGPLVIVCVTDYDAVRALLDQVDASLGGRVLVNLSSGTSKAARETADRVAYLGGRYLDGAIMAVPQAVGTDEAIVVYSGPRDVFDAHAADLAALAASTEHLGEDPALAALFEQAGLSLMWSVMNGFLQGAALLGAAGVDATRFAPLARTAVGTVADWLPGYAQQVEDGAYPPLDATLDIHLNAMEHLVEESESLGVSAELPRFVRALAARAVAGGHGGDGYAALIEQFREPTEA